MKATTTLKRKWKPSLLVLAGATALAAWAIPANQASADYYRHGYYHHHHGDYYHHHGYWHQRPDGVNVWINL